jgi:hypothetical protein
LLNHVSWKYFQEVENIAPYYACRARKLNTVRPFGLSDIVVNYKRWFSESAIYKETINTPPLTGHNITDPRAAEVVCFYSIGRSLDQRVDLPRIENTISCAEFLMPMITEGLLVERDVDRQILCNAVKALLKN